MDDILFAVALLASLLLLLVFLYAKRYRETAKQKDVYRVAFKMDEQPVAETTPQLIDTDDMVIAYSDVESEHVI